MSDRTVPDGTFTPRAWRVGPVLGGVFGQKGVCGPGGGDSFTPDTCQRSVLNSFRRGFSFYSIFREDQPLSCRTPVVPDCVRALRYRSPLVSLVFGLTLPPLLLTDPKFPSRFQGKGRPLPCPTHPGPNGS